MTLTEFLGHLEGVRGGGEQYYAKCPAHDDHKQSLSVSVGQEGRVLLNCHAGCAIEDIVGVMGLTMRDLFVEPQDKLQSVPQGPKIITAEYPYYDEFGGTAVTKVRYSDKSFIWRRWCNGNWIYNRKGIEPTLYTADLWHKDLTHDVLIAEGEKDVNTLRSHGRVAVSLPDGAQSKWYPQYGELLRGHAVAIIQDNDSPGKEFAQRVARELHGIAESVKIIDLSVMWPDLPEHGDTTDFIEHMGPEIGIPAIQELINRAPVWEPAQEGFGGFGGFGSRGRSQNENGFLEFLGFLEPDTSKNPSFPAVELSDVLRNMAVAVSESLQVTIDMPAVALLAVASLCAQKKFVVNPKPGWLEPVNLYASVVALPSERKSPVLSEIMRPVHTFVKEENERRRPAVEEYRTRKELITGRIESMKKSAMKPTKKDKPSTNVDDIMLLYRELEDLEKGATDYLCLVADDITMEALAANLAANNEQLAIVSSEGGIFNTLAGLYSGGVAHIDVFLKAYTGDHYKSDRIGRKQEVLQHPALSVLLTVQPAVLEAIMSNHDFAGKGLLARFLYSIPVSMVGKRKYETSPVPFEVKEAYSDLIRRLLSIPTTEEPRIIHFTHDAHLEAKKLFENVEPRLRGDLESLGDWGGKFHGDVMRIAALLHICDHVEEAADIPMPIETVIRARAIGEYFLAHAKCAYQMMGLSDDQATVDAKYILKRLDDSGQTEISKSDLCQMCKERAGLGRAEDMAPGLSTLVQRGYIKIEKTPPANNPNNSKNPGGRPIWMVYVNPEYLAQKNKKEF